MQLTLVIAALLSLVSAEQMSFEPTSYESDGNETVMKFNTFYMTYSAERRAGKTWNPYRNKLQYSGYSSGYYTYSYKPTYSYSYKPAYVKPTTPAKPAYVKPAYVAPAKPAYVKPAYTKRMHFYTDPNYGVTRYGGYWADKDVSSGDLNLAAELPVTEEPIDTDYLTQALVLTAIVASVYAISSKCIKKKDSALGVERDDMYQQYV